MAITLNFKASSNICVDTDFSISYRMWQGDPTPAQIANNTAVPEDVTGQTFSWTMREQLDSATPAIYKTSSDGITITGTYNVDPLLNTQRVVVRIKDTDTYDPDVSPQIFLTPGIYYYALKRIDPDNESIRTKGTLVLQLTAARE
jgi:hypothetical protein